MKSTVRQKRAGNGLNTTLVLLVALFLSALPAVAQQLTGTLSGTVFDTTGAAVPNANVVLKNQASGDTRTTVSDASGHFVITAVQPATYSVNISESGFTTWQENDIVMHQGDARAIPNIHLKVGGATTSVEVIGGGAAVVPTDTPEISTTLSQKMINDFPLQGRDAGELLKVMPGMALNNPGGTGSSFNDKKVGSNNGPVGAYSSNGTQPNGTMAYMLDGANLVDPGNFGTQIANINQDMVGEVKMLMSNYSAEYAKGPSIFQAFSKSGGRDFHGELYLYNHNSVLDTVDSFTKSQGGTNADESYYYMGGNVGGPVLLPKLGFNRNRNKLFFWGGYEYMKQQPAGVITNYNVPNAAQLAGDFSNTGIDPNAVKAWPKFYGQLAQNAPAGGGPAGFPISDIDPNIPGILALYPKPNETPSAGNGYSNYQYANNSPQNRWEATGKLDYAISDNTKLTGSYTYQREADLAPISIWWATPNTLPYPTPGASNTVTYVILTNLTHVFNPTTTNETVFTWSHFTNPYSLSDPAAVSRSKNNFNVPGLFGHTTDQIPNFNPDFCCNEQMASINYYPMSTGSFGGVKQVPAVYDNFTKVLGNHTVKVGFYWDDSRNSQNSNAPDNGSFNFATGTQNSTNNLVADVMLGRINQYQQQNKLVPTNTHFHQVSFYAQDSWRGSPRLTLNYGIRFDHIGQWYGIDSGPGFQVWNQAAYDQNPNAPNAGIQWHAVNSNVPISGFKTPLFYLAPRIGFAYDIFGTGKTVFRGGFAVYRYQATSETASAYGGPFGSFQYQNNTPFTGYASVAGLVPPSSVSQNGSNIDVMQQGDDRAPFTNDWNATISQALPHRSLLEVSYVGNRSANEYMDGSNSNLFNLNNNHLGSFFGADPKLGRPVSPAPPSCASKGSDGSLYCQNDPTTYSPSFNATDYKPLQSYQNVFLLTHAPYSNYNSLQVSFTKQSGPITFLANYTFSKVLGIRDGGSNNGPGNGTANDPFVLRNNYGPLDYDHTHILNLTYNWNLPSPIHSDNFAMHLAGGAVNGWQLSGYTAFQSGGPIQGKLGTSLNAQYPTSLTVPTIQHPDLPDNSYVLPNGLRAVNVSPSVWFGTDAVKALIPRITCNPTAHLRQGQRFNPDCFAPPAFGTQGANVLPYIRNPNYWDSDLGIYKNFHITESRFIQIRASATNWLNHPIRQFGLANSLDGQLSFVQTSNATCSGCVDSKGNPLQVTSLSQTNTNTQTTGTPEFKTGSRFVTLAAKFYF